MSPAVVLNVGCWLGRLPTSDGERPDFMTRDDLGQRLARRPAASHKNGRLDPSRRVDRHDVRMVELAGSADFVAEAGQPSVVEHRGEGQHLEGDRPADGDLFGLVDDAHATTTHFADDAEVAQHATGGGTVRAVVPSLRCRLGTPNASKACMAGNSRCSRSAYSGCRPRIRRDRSTRRPGCGR